LSFSRTLSSGSSISTSCVAANRHYYRVSTTARSQHHSPMRSSIFNTRFSSFSDTKLNAMPPRPARAVRPTLCVYTSGSSGKSQFTTMATSAISNPRAPTSVDTSTGITEERKSESEVSRSRCVSREWRAVLRIPSVCNSEVRYATVRAFAQNIIVGGGWWSSSLLPVFFVEGFLWAVARERLTGSGSCLRRCSIGSGGLHRR